jgi:four helix bundle protein
MTASNLPVGYKKLQLYQKPKSFVLEIYRLTSQYPKTETYVLVPQMRRAAVSVLANIIEGYSRESSKEYARFLTISIGSLTEVEVYLDISYELSYINNRQLEKINILLIEIKRLLYGSRKKARMK